MPMSHKKYPTSIPVTQNRHPGPEWAIHYSHTLLRGVFYAYCLLAPYGKVFQVGGGLLGLLLLITYYGMAYSESNLARLPFKKIFTAFFIYPFVATLFSQWPGYSFGYTQHLPHESLVLFFIGLESIRSRKDMALMGACLLLSICVQGLDGIWQYATGYDMVHGTPIADGGRLTGSMSTYRVGNYIAITIIPSLLAFWALPHNFSTTIRTAILALALAPPFFLLAMSQTRSGVLGLFAGLYLYAAIALRINSKVLLLPPLLFVALLIWGPQRFSLALALKDGRWELWQASWRIFLENPLFGTGPSTFMPAFNSLGITFATNASNIPHPHGIFVQFLSDGGITGVLLLAGVLVGIGFVWCGIQIYSNTQNPVTQDKSHWLMTGLLWAGFAAYLATGLFGHNFYRTWWLALGLMLLGCSMGAILNPEKPLTPLGHSQL